MQSAKNKVPRFSGCYGSTNSFEITHFTNHNDIRILSQGSLQSFGKILCVASNLALVDDGSLGNKKVLHGVLYSDDMSRTCHVYLLNNGSKRR